MDFVISNTDMTNRQISVKPLDKFTVLCYDGSSN